MNKEAETAYGVVDGPMMSGHYATSWDVLHEQVNTSLIKCKLEYNKFRLISADIEQKQQLERRTSAMRSTNGGGSATVWNPTSKRDVTKNKIENKCRMYTEMASGMSSSPPRAARTEETMTPTTPTVEVGETAARSSASNGECAADSKSKSGNALINPPPKTKAGDKVEEYEEKEERKQQLERVRFEEGQPQKSKKSGDRLRHQHRNVVIKNAGGIKEEFEKDDSVGKLIIESTHSRPENHVTEMSCACETTTPSNRDITKGVSASASSLPCSVGQSTGHRHIAPHHSTPDSEADGPAGTHSIIASTSSTSSRNGSDQSPMATVGTNYCSRCGEAIISKDLLVVAPPCGGSSRMAAEALTFHARCFRCEDCDQELIPAMFSVKRQFAGDGRVYCADHASNHILHRNRKDSGATNGQQRQINAQLRGPDAGKVAKYDGNALSIQAALKAPRPVAKPNHSVPPPDVIKSDIIGLRYF